MLQPIESAFRPLMCLMVLALVLGAGQSFSAAPRVLPEGNQPADGRLGPLKDLNGYFPFAPPDSSEAWQQRAERVRKQVLLANGLWPMPTKTPVNAVVHGKVERDGYTVEKVYLESYPGHFVTGNLYRPTGKEGRLPGVLCPHGHWPGGRFHDHGEQRVQQEIKSGAERFPVGGRHPLQARCVQLARMGCVVFHYDMIGYADSVQLAHRPGVREAMNTAENWGFFSPQAELRFQTMMGLQTYNSIRALDWLCELPFVDDKRIAVTGASGGGTQTFLLCAVDPRPAVAFPAVMVSTAMQGGCTCENCSYLRVGTGNIELAGLFAPKPLGMSAANDWTREIMTKGLPELKQLYTMLGVPDRVMAQHFEFPHNYNYVSRALMYGWLNEHLRLGHEQVEERDYQPLSVAEMSVWDEKHSKPPAGDDYERSLLRVMTEDSDRQMAAMTPTDRASLGRFREVVGGAFDLLLGRGVQKPEAFEFQKSLEEDRGSYIEFAGLLRNTPHAEELPIVFLHPKSWNRQVVIWASEAGKAGLYDTSGAPNADVRRLLDSGASVVGVDLLYQGEFLIDGKPLEAVRLVGSGRDTWKTYAGYTFGYNYPVFCKRVHDLLSVVSFVRHHEDTPAKVHLVGLDSTGPLVSAAAVQAGEAVDRVAVDTSGFRFARLTRIDDPSFLPGAVKYGDVPALLALVAPHELWLAGETSALPALVSDTYKAAAAGDRVTVHRGDARGRSQAAVEWLVR